VEIDINTNKYNFGVYTKNKYVSSHYHILYYVKPGKQPTFNTYCRFSDTEKDEQTNTSLNYKDREDVWVINREYKPGQVKNKNELPTSLLTKLILYSSNESDMVCDFFFGSFSTAKVAIGLNRKACGFEVNKTAFDYQVKQIEELQEGFLVSNLRIVPSNELTANHTPMMECEKNSIITDYLKMKKQGICQKDAIQQLIKTTGRGMWSLLKVIKEFESRQIKTEVNLFNYHLLDIQPPSDI